MLYGANATLYIAGRSQEKATTAIDALRQAHPDCKGAVHFLQLDLADLTTIKPAVEAFLAKEDRLDVLVNNAGVMWPPLGSTSAQGHELTIATNVYGPFLLAKLLHPLLAATAQKKESGEVRVCWAGSIGIELAAPPEHLLFAAAKDAGEQEVVQEGMDKIAMYGMSKVANVMLGVEGARREGETGVVHVVSFPPHPFTIQHFRGVFFSRREGGLTRTSHSTLAICTRSYCGTRVGSSASRLRRYCIRPSSVRIRSFSRGGVQTFPRRRMGAMCCRGGGLGRTIWDWRRRSCGRRMGGKGRRRSCGRFVGGW
jgi:NAD(P)-dependent dehydrogenase (short-subunit alcohol dehydrogenase family)